MLKEQWDILGRIENDLQIAEICRQMLAGGLLSIVEKRAVIGALSLAHQEQQAKPVVGLVTKDNVSELDNFNDVEVNAYFNRLNAVLTPELLQTTLQRVVADAEELHHTYFPELSADDPALNIKTQRFLREIQEHKADYISQPEAPKAAPVVAPRNVSHDTQMLDVLCTSLRVRLDTTDSPEARTALLKSGLQVIREAMEVEGITEADYSINLQGANLSQTDLSHMSLNSIDFEGADFTGANCLATGFSHSNLKDANFTQANLRAAFMDSAFLEDTIFQQAHMPYVQLQNAQLTRCKLDGALLDGARLQGAVLTECTMPAAMLTNADIAGAQFVETPLTAAQLRGVKHVEQAKVLDSSIQEETQRSDLHFLLQDIEVARQCQKFMRGETLTADEKASVMKFMVLSVGSQRMHIEDVLSVENIGKYIPQTELQKIDNNPAKAFKVLEKSNGGVLTDHWIKLLASIEKRCEALQGEADIGDIQNEVHRQMVDAQCHKLRVQYSGNGMEISGSQGFKSGLRDIRDAIEAYGITDYVIDMHGVNLSRIDLVNHRDDEPGFDLTGINFTGATFDKAKLTGVRLDGSTLDGASLKSAKLNGASMKDASLRGANCERADMQSANMQSVHAEGAVFSKARMKRADCTDATISHRELQGAKGVSKIEGLDSATAVKASRSRFERVKDGVKSFFGVGSSKKTATIQPQLPAVPGVSSVKNARVTDEEAELLQTSAKALKDTGVTLENAESVAKNDLPKPSQKVTPVR